VSDSPTPRDPEDPRPAVARPPDEAAALREAHDRLRATPVVDVVANHALGLLQLAAIHLGIGSAADAGAPDLASAGVAIDATAALVDGLGVRLGPHEQPLREALAGLQTAYARIAEQGDES